MKKCSKCKKEKPRSEFGKDKRASTGLKSACRGCDSISSGKWNRENRTQYNEYRRDYFLKQRARVLVSSAKKRAKARGLSFDLDLHREKIQRRIDQGRCEVSGFPFNLNGGRTFDSPSIDRINPKKGYIYSNIRIVCDAMNLALGDWGEEKLYAVLTSWIDKRNRQGKGSCGTHAGIPSKDNRQASIDAV